MKSTQLAINSVSTVRAGLEDCLAAYQAAGFRNVEFPMKHIREFLGRGNTVAQVRRLLEAHELQCIGGFDCTVACFSSAEQREKNHAQVLESARFFAELGGKMLVVGTDGPENRADHPDPVGEMARTFEEVGRSVRDTGVTLCIEFNWSPIVKSLRTAAEIARRSGQDNVGVVFDPAHYHCTPTKFDQLNADNIPYIRHVHVDDMRDKPAELSSCNGDRVLPGEGCLDLKSLFGQIERHGYRGYFSIEMFSERLWEMPARDAARLMYDSLVKLCEG